MWTFTENHPLLASKRKTPLNLLTVNQTKMHIKQETTSPKYIRLLFGADFPMKHASDARRRFCYEHRLFQYEHSLICPCNNSVWQFDEVFQQNRKSQCTKHGKYLTVSNSFRLMHRLWLSVIMHECGYGHITGVPFPLAVDHQRTATCRLASNTDVQWVCRWHLSISSHLYLIIIISSIYLPS